MLTVLYVLLAILTFGVLILIHELGHFLVARAFGVGIREFSIGMGPKIFSWRGKKQLVREVKGEEPVTPLDFDNIEAGRATPDTEPWDGTTVYSLRFPLAATSVCLARTRRMTTPTPFITKRSGNAFWLWWQVPR